MRTRCWSAGLALAAGLAGALGGCEKVGLTSSPALQLQPDSAVLAIHARLHLEVSLHDLQTADVYFVSSDTSVVVVDQQGWAQAVGYGRAVVTAMDMQHTALMDSTVLRVPAPTGAWLVLLPDTFLLAVGDAKGLTWRIGGTANQGVRFRAADSTVVGVELSGTVCGRAPGQTVIRGTLESNPAAGDSMRVRVVAAGAALAASLVPSAPRPLGPPTVVISSVVDTAGKPVDLSAVRGTVRVIVGLAPSPCFPRSVLGLVIDGKDWATGPEITWAGPLSYTFTVDTRATDAAGQPRIPNGAHVLGAVLRRKTNGLTQASTSMTIVVAN